MTTTQEALNKTEVFQRAYARLIEGEIGTEQFFNIAWQAAITAASAEAQPSQEPEWYTGVDGHGCRHFYHKEEVRPGVGFDDPLYTQPSAPVAQDELRRAVRSMTAMLNDREWAEHVSRDEDAQALECAITDLIGAAPQVEAKEGWKLVTGAGQVRAGDQIRFKIGDEEFLETARHILHQGTDKEEVIYDRKKNFYFITRCILDGWSNHKNVEYRAPSSQKE